MHEEATSSTCNWTRQFEVIQVASENVFTKLGRISRDLIKQITSG
jgi:hypothetical protein